jgi:hypothetical protein
MDAGVERRREDLRRLETLCATANGRLRLLAASGVPPNRVVVELSCRTAGSAEYPGLAVDRTRVSILLPARYPFEPPQAIVDTRIFHPNVFESGLICLGSTWLATEGLDLLTRRIAQIVVFDPDVVNIASPANPVAALWYRQALVRSPDAFPTDIIDFLRMQPHRTATRWRNLDAAEPEFQTIACAGCTQRLRLPDRSGVRVRCPKCGHTFQV